MIVAHAWTPLASVSMYMRLIRPHILASGLDLHCTRPVPAPRCPCFKVVKDTHDALCISGWSHTHAPHARSVVDTNTGSYPPANPNAKKRAKKTKGTEQQNEQNSPKNSKSYGLLNMKVGKFVGSRARCGLFCMLAGKPMSLYNCRR